MPVDPNQVVMPAPLDPWHLPWAVLSATAHLAVAFARIVPWYGWVVVAALVAARAMFPSPPATGGGRSPQRGRRRRG